MRGFAKGRLAPWGMLCAILAGNVQAVGWDADGEVTATYDSNASRAERKRDILHDENLLGNVALLLRTQPTFSTALNLRGFVEGEAWREISTLNRATAGGQVIGRWKPVQGFMEPVYQLTLTSQLDDYEVDQRDSLVYSAQLFATRPLNDRILFSYGIEGTERRSDGTVFDTRQGRAFLNADFELDADWSAYGGYSFVRGDTFSSAQFSFCNGVKANDIFGLIHASDALETDDAFDQEFCGSWIAYRLKAQTHALTLGINRGFSHHLSADFSVQGVRVNGKGDNDYERVLLRAGLLARF